MFTPKNDVVLRADERIDQLTEQLGIIQSPHVFRFSMDAILLARFCRLPHRGRILDLGSGNGVIPLLLSTRTSLPLDGLDIQARLVDMARRSVAMNGLDKQIHMYEGDLRSCPPAWNGQYLLVTCNPPYIPLNGSDKSENPYVAIARHEIHCTLEDVLATARRLVPSGGKLALVHRAWRFNDIVAFMRKYRFEPKRVRFVHPYSDAEAHTVLVEAVKDGGVELHVEAPLVVYERDGVYTEDLLHVYAGVADDAR